MGQGRRAMLPQAGEKATEVAQREAQEPGGFSGAQDAVVDTRQNVLAMVLPLGQDDRLPVHPPRVTYSLTR